MCMCVGGLPLPFRSYLWSWKMKVLFKNVKDPVMEVYGCSPSYSGARGRRMVSLRLDQSIQQDPVSKTKQQQQTQLIITVKLSLRERLNILIHLTEKSKSSLTLNTSRFRGLKDDIIYCVPCPIFWLIWALQYQFIRKQGFANQFQIPHDYHAQPTDLDCMKGNRMPKV